MTGEKNKMPTVMQLKHSSPAVVKAAKASSSRRKVRQERNSSTHNKTNAKKTNNKMALKRQISTAKSAAPTECAESKDSTSLLQMLFDNVKTGDIGKTTELHHQLQSTVQSTHSRVIRDKVGFTLLHYAANWNSLEHIRFLTAPDSVLQVDINAKCDKGTTPLHVAIDACHSGAVLQLLQHKADITATSTAMYNSLHFAAKRNNTAAIKLLIAAAEERSLPHLSAPPVRTLRSKNQARSKRTKNQQRKQQQQQQHSPKLLEEFVNAANFKGMTPLMYAVRSGFVGAAQELLKNEACDVDRRDHDGFNAVMHVAVGNTAAHVDVVRVLLLHLEKKTHTSVTEYLNLERNCFGTNALGIAAAAGNVAMCDILCQFGADSGFGQGICGCGWSNEQPQFSHMDPFQGRTLAPKLQAASRSEPNVLSLSLRQSTVAEVSGVKQQLAGTPIGLSIVHGHVDVLRLFLRQPLQARDPRCPTCSPNSKPQFNAHSPPVSRQQCRQRKVYGLRQLLITFRDNSCEVSSAPSTSTSTPTSIGSSPFYQAHQTVIKSQRHSLPARSSTSSSYIVSSRNSVPQPRATASNHIIEILEEKYEQAQAALNPYVAVSRKGLAFRSNTSKSPTKQRQSLRLSFNNPVFPEKLVSDEQTVPRRRSLQASVIPAKCLNLGLASAKVRCKTLKSVRDVISSTVQTLGLVFTSRIYMRLLF